MIRERNLPRFLTVIERIDEDLFKQLTERLIIFVEGPTDVKFIKMALTLFGENDLLNAVVIDTIGNRLGDRGAGDSNLKGGYTFLRDNQLISNKVLFLFDPDVKNLPAESADRPNLYIRQMAEYATDRKGIESLLSEAVLEEGVVKGFVEKTVVEKITATGSTRHHHYKVISKTRFCDWVCDDRENIPADFTGLSKIFEIIRAVMGA